MKLIATHLIFLILVTSSFLPITAQETENEISILHIYNETAERTAITNMFNEIVETPSIVSVNIEDFDVGDLGEHQYIVFTSETEFSLSGSLQDQLRNHINQVNRTAIFITAFLDDFDDELETLLGMSKFDEVLEAEDDQSVQWDASVEKSIGSFDQGDEFDFSGKVASVELESFADSLVEVNSYLISGREEEEDDPFDEITFPIPVVFNATQSQTEIITMGLNPLAIEQSNQLALSQVPDELFGFVQEIIISSYTNLATKLQINPGLGGDPQLSEPNNELNPFNFDPRLLLLIVLAIIFLFWKKILGLLSWISEKTLGLLVGVFGAFYQIQERIINENQIYENQTRYEIVEFLKVVGEHGAHLREIKSVIGGGMGALLWHLQVLEDFHKVEQIKIGKFSVFVIGHKFPQFDPEIKQIEFQIQSKYSLDILRFFADTADDEIITIKDIQNETEIPNKAIRRIVKKCYETGLIDILSNKPIELTIQNNSLIRSVIRSLELRENYDNTTIQTGVTIEQV